MQFPDHGQVWKHYKGGLYSVVRGVQPIRTGTPLYVQSIGRFVQEVANNEPRFEYCRTLDK